MNKGGDRNSPSCPSSSCSTLTCCKAIKALPKSWDFLVNRIFFSPWCNLSFTRSTHVYYPQSLNIYFVFICKSLDLNLIPVATLFPGYSETRADCFYPLRTSGRRKKIWLSRYFHCMNYSGLRRMLWFTVIMGGPEKACRLAPPHIYFMLWQKVCHARSRKASHCGKPAGMGNN